MVRSRPLRALAAICAVVAATPAAAGAAWHQPVASPLNRDPAQNANDVSAATVAGVPYVAWAERDSGHPRNQLRVDRLDPATGTWQTVGSASLNHDPNRDATKPSLAAIGGVAYVAWIEADGVNNEVRVARLDQAGTTWDEVVGGASPINHDTSRSANSPALASVDGVPYVAWTEFDGANQELRVSRLNPAGTAWQEPVGGASPVNHDPARNASAPTLTAVGGVPYVGWNEPDAGSEEVRVSRLNGTGTAWTPVGDALNHDAARDGFEPSLVTIDAVPYAAWYERDGVNSEVRVSRLNRGASSWQEIVGGASPVNHDPARDAFEASLTAIGGVPYVAWEETDGTNFEIRVSRLNASEGAWREVVGGPSPVNAAGGQADEPTMLDVGGVPYVAWRESTAFQGVRVSRLEAELSPPEAIATTHDAALLTRARTYGVAYPVAFDYGAGGALATRTAATDTTADHHADTVVQHVGALGPGTTYDVRAIGFDGLDAIAPTATGQFTTTADNAAGPPGPAGGAGPAGPGGPAADRLLVVLLQAKLRSRAGRRLAVEYLSTGNGATTLEVLKGRKRIARVTGTARRGRNKIAWNGKQGRKKPKRGSYSLRLSVAGGDGQSAIDSGKLTLKGAGCTSACS